MKSAFRVLLISLFITCSSCGGRSPKISGKSASASSSDNYGQTTFPDDIKSKAFKNSDSTWGYTIYVNGNIYIHQKEITVHGATKGFLTEGDATKASDLIVKKIKNHITPELIKENELDSLGIQTIKIMTK